MTPRLPRVSYRVLTTFLIVGLPALALASLIALGVGQGELRRSYEQSLKDVAQHTASTVDTFVYRRIVEAALLTRVPDLRAAAAAATAETPDPGLIREIDREWIRERRVPTVLGDLLRSPASTFLADAVHHDPIYREIMLTDLHGRLVAASSLTSDYFQADESWWQQAFGDGLHGQVSIGDVRWDDSAGVFALEIALPVAAPASDRLAGILKVAADIREMGAVIAGVRLGQTGDAALVREDGSIVLSRGRRLGPQSRFFAADLLRERYTAVKTGDDAEFLVAFTARGPDGRGRVVAVAPSQLVASYPELTWLVAVSQAEEELFAPIRTQMGLMMLMIAFVAVAVLGLALWFSMRLSSPPVDEDLDMHLVEHAAIPRFEETP